MDQLIMRALSASLIIALIYLDVVSGQFFDTGIVAGAETANNTASFKPKFPMNCRPIDFDVWKQFITTCAQEWCPLRYGDPKAQPKAFSGESNKVCQESIAAYVEWSRIITEPGSHRMWCNVAKMNLDTEMVQMNHYLETRLLGVSNPLIIDHDAKMEFHRWYDRTNLMLLDMYKRGDIYADEGNKVPQVSEACANAVGDMLCSYMLPNCTYMPVPEWPYHILPNWPAKPEEGKEPPINYEKIYICKEVCQKVLSLCNKLWLPYDVNCDNFVSQTIDETVDPKWTMTAFDRREKGGHACADVKMYERVESGATVGDRGGTRCGCSSLLWDYCSTNL